MTLAPVRTSGLLLLCWWEPSLCGDTHVRECQT
jgi:hypothetical protein